MKWNSNLGSTTPTPYHQEIAFLPRTFLLVKLTIYTKLLCSIDPMFTQRHFGLLWTFWRIHQKTMGILSRWEQKIGRCARRILKFVIYSALSNILSKKFLKVHLPVNIVSDSHPSSVPSQYPTHYPRLSLSSPKYRNDEGNLTSIYTHFFKTNNLLWWSLFWN